MSFLCEECGFELWNYVGEVPFYSCHVGLYSDNRYPGRCLVVFPKHVEHFEDMQNHDVIGFMFCVTRVGRIIKEIVGAKRINYAILGNAVHHVHAHVIPRFDTDPNPDKSPWDRSDKVTELPKKQADEIISRIRKELTK